MGAPRTPERAVLLELRDVSRRFGGLQAVNNLSMVVEPRTIHALIGPNGAGKSTVFNLITGVLPVSGGEIRFRGERISGLRPSAICRRGIARTFQATTLFRESTVLENVLAASHLGAETAFLSTLLASGGYRRREVAVREGAEALLAALRLRHLAGQRAGSLPHRDQKALCLAMVLATGSELVILDEPLAGLTTQESEDTMTAVRRLREAGKTILLVEHDMRAVMGLCDVITVLDHGVRIGHGTPREIQENPAVIEAYLGAEESRAGGH
jgi:branched-chain amino acid transport system ATP-binding protein